MAAMVGPGPSRIAIAGPGPRIAAANGPGPTKDAEIGPIYIAVMWRWRNNGCRECKRCRVNHLDL